MKIRRAAWSLLVLLLLANSSWAQLKGPVIVPQRPFPPVIPVVPNFPTIDPITLPDIDPIQLTPEPILIPVQPEPAYTPARPARSSGYTAPRSTPRPQPAPKPQRVNSAPAPVSAPVVRGGDPPYKPSGPPAIVPTDDSDKEQDRNIQATAAQSEQASEPPAKRTWKFYGGWVLVALFGMGVIGSILE